MNYTESISVLSAVILSTGNPHKARPLANTSSLKYSIGNSKIGDDTLILNMGTAMNCPSAKLGLCSLAHRKHGGDGSCYALKAEYLYPSSIPYRSIQKIQFDLWEAEKIAHEMFKVIYKKRNGKRIKYVRFNESGDFHSVEQVRKAGKIARLVQEFCHMAEIPVVRFYTYTHRSDIFLGNDELISSLPSNFVINGSNFKVHNEFRVLDISRSERDKKVDGIKINRYTCLDDCSKCSLCKVRSTGITIIQAKH